MKDLWHRIAHFFEDGDLTPLAVVISIAHYGPVLEAHGEYMVVAWIVGAIIDLLHFRSVRKLFQASGRNSIVGHAAIAAVTTAMAVGYHLRFYNGDWLLALPIPVGIAILAQHAASKQQDETADLDTVKAELVKAMSERDSALAQADRTAVQRDTVKAELDAARSELARLQRKLDRDTVHLDRLPSRLADYVTAVANGSTPDGDFTAKHGVGASTLDRTNRMFLNE